MKPWLVALSLIPIGIQASANCVFDKVSAQPVLKLLEIKATDYFQLNLPLRGAHGGKSGESWQLVWEPQKSELTIGPRSNDPTDSSRFENPRLQVWMPDFLSQPGGAEKWEALLDVIAETKSLSVIPPKDTEKVKFVGMLHYPTQKKKEFLELMVFRLKNFADVDVKAEGADERGRWLSIRCGLLVRDKK